MKRMLKKTFSGGSVGVSGDKNTSPYSESSPVKDVLEYIELP